MSEAVLSADYSGPFRYLSIEHQKIAPKAVLMFSLRYKYGKSSSLVKVLYSVMFGFYATVSLLSRLTVKICYAIIYIFKSALYMDIEWLDPLS